MKPVTAACVLALALASALASGCIMRSEGCLDVYAENFSLDAEKACGDCCRYPSMFIVLSQKWNDRNFSTADTLLDVHLQPYRILDIRYFLTAWSWTDSEGMSSTVDTIQASCAGELIRYTPDLPVIQPQRFNYELGTVRHIQDIAGLGFLAGLSTGYSCPDPLQPGFPENLKPSGPLWDPSAGALATLKLVLQRDLGAEVYDTFYIHESVPVSLPFTQEVKPGRDTQLRLTADYAQWFADADIGVISSFRNSFLAHVSAGIYQTP